MNLAKPAPSVEPAIAKPAIATKSVYEDNEYDVKPARQVSDRFHAETHKVEPAVTIEDSSKFAPIHKLEEPHRNPDSELTVEKLRLGGEQGSFFEHEAGVCRGVHMTFSRKWLPFLHDERDFVSYGEIRRYVVIKDTFCFIYVDKSDPNPLYTIPIESLRAVKDDKKKPHKQSLIVSPLPNTNDQNNSLETVILLDARNKFVYQFTFDITLGKDVCNQFIQAVEHANAIGKANDSKQKSLKK